MLNWLTVIMRNELLSGVVVDLQIILPVGLVFDLHNDLLVDAVLVYTIDQLTSFLKDNLKDI